MTFQVLGADGSDGNRWREVLARLPPQLRDLHYTLEYANIYRNSYGYQPLLAVYEHGAQIVLQAIVRRPLSTLPFLTGLATRQPYTDIATPYGYGGPLVRDPEASDALDCLRAFDRKFRLWCGEQGIASEFVCLHPILGNDDAVRNSGIADAKAEKEVVVIDLTRNDDLLWSALSRGARYSINRARREHVAVEQVTPDKPALAQFRELYLETMRRRSAAPRWFFPESYFADCVQQMGATGSALFVARCDGEVAAACLLLNDHRTVYYHFSASKTRWLARQPNNALLYETMRWAKQQGMRRYHLGGGVTANENDSLLRFKSSFGGDRSVLYTYGRVLNEEVYRELCERKREHERRSGSPIANPDYFPLYRR